MELLMWILHITSILCLYAAYAPLLPFGHWTIRVFDFPRVQISVLLVLQIGLNLLFLRYDGLAISLNILLFLGLLYQLRRIWPYTRAKKAEVLRTRDVSDIDTLSVLVSNVHKDNENKQKLIDLVRECNADLVLALETDAEWEKALQVIEENYPYTVKVPLDNYYGMHLYSRFELIEPQVRYRVQEGIPSIDGFAVLANGRKVKFYGLHPMPPSPTESPSSVNRDAELLLVGKEAAEADYPVVVFGDLNDVAWSKTTQLFRKVSRLLDPRIGRGAFSTFHADYMLLRWPLDHVFHSDHFTLVDITRPKSIGSDHFPMYFKLAYRPRAAHKQEAPKANEEEVELADEKIDKALSNPDTRPSML